MDKIAIIILNYNGKPFLKRFLPGILKYNEGYPVYVVDNHSADQSLEFVKSKYADSVHCIGLDQNYGFCGGYNRAVDDINAEYYVFLNSDIEVTEGWLKPLLNLLEADSSIAACQPKLLDLNKKDHFEYAGAAGGYIDMLGYPFCRGRVFQTLERDYGQYNDVVPVFWTSGACMMIRSDVFKDLGGFDTSFFAHMEEIDLCWRIQRSGLKVYYHGDSTVYHVGGGTLNQSNPYKTYLNFRNSLITLIKNERTWKLGWKVPLRLALDVIATTKFLISESYNDALAVIRADLHVIINMAFYLKKRDTLSHDHQKLEGVYHQVLVFSYFILRRKFFFNLRSVIPDHIVPSS
jgi:GT2 family glycosyltransferase